MHWTAEDRETHEKMGFHPGWGIATDQMTALAKTLVCYNVTDARLLSSPPAALLAASLRPPASAQDKLKVVATFSILGDLVPEVGGDQVDVTTLVGPDTDAHTYQPRPTDARSAGRRQGAGEQRPGLRGLDRPAGRGGGLQGHAHRGLGTGAAPRRPIRIAGRTSPARAATSPTSPTGLAAADPANAALLSPRAPQTYDARLAALEAWIRREIATVPEDRRKAITGHNSFHYFARAYDVRFEAPRGYSTDSEPTARDVANLIRQVRAQKIKALFIENMTNPALVDEIARDSGAIVGPRLYSDALSKPGRPGADLRGDDAPQRGGAGRGMRSMIRRN